MKLPSPALSIQLPSSQDRLVIIRFQEQCSAAQPLEITNSITLEADFSWRLSVHGHEIQPANCPALSAHLGLSGLSQLLSLLGMLTVCPGHPHHAALCCYGKWQVNPLKKVAFTTCFETNSILLSVDGILCSYTGVCI